jgi:hypothetical protein
VGGKAHSIPSNTTDADMRAIIYSLSRKPPGPEVLNTTKA